jgi:ATP-binding cassette subfamily C protein
MRSVLKVFFRAEGTRPWLVLCCLLLAGLSGGIGFTSLLPLLTLTAEGQQSDSFAAKLVNDLLNMVGLPAEPLPLLLLVVGAIVLKSTLSLYAMRHVARASAGVATGLRSDLIRKLLNVRWSYFTSQPIGRIANAMSTDATRAGKAYSTAAEFLSQGIQTIVYGTAAFFVSWKLALLALAVSAAIAGSLHVFVHSAKRAGWRETGRTRELVIFLTDALNSIKPLKAMSKQSPFVALCDKKIRSLNRALRTQVMSREWRRSLEEILTAMFLGMAFYAAIVLWSHPVSEVLVMGILLSQTMRKVGMMQENLQRAVVLEAPFFVLKEMIAEAQAASEMTHGGKTPTLERSLCFDRVDFAFGTKAVLTGVSLEIPARRITVLTGPSGAGKTTITDLLLGLHQADRGQVLIDGVAIEDIDIAAWRAMVGYVPQELILFHDTIFANVTLGDERLTEGDVQRALEVAGAWAFVQALPDGVHSTVGEKGMKLSGGQRQRIALARALATRPKLLILDEVTSALDPETERDICRRIRTLSEDMTIIAITHRQTFLDIADCTYRVQDGLVTDLTLEPAVARRFHA